MDGWELKFIGPQKRHVERWSKGLKLDVLPVGWHRGIGREATMHFRTPDEPAFHSVRVEPFTVALAEAKDWNVLPHNFKSFIGVFEVEPLSDKPAAFDPANENFRLEIRIGKRLKP